LLATRVLTLDDIYLQGGTLATFLWLAVLFALSGQLNEMGFMSYVGQRLASMLGGLDWPMAYVVLLGLYVLMHYMFVSQSAQVLALLGRVSRCRCADRRSRAPDGLRPAVCEQLLLNADAAGWQPEHHLRRPAAT
jgi:hypothetical protein